MNDRSLAQWQEQNRAFLALAVDNLFLRMEGEDSRTSGAELAASAGRMESAPALLRLTDAFGLGSFEQDVVLICLASELDPRFRLESRPVTVGLVLEELDGANWSALDAAAPLRSWGVITLSPATGLADSLLRLAEDAFRFLMGFDPRYEPDAAFSPDTAPSWLAARQLAEGEELARAIARTVEVTGESPAVELYGATDEDRTALAFACAQALGTSLATGDVRDLPGPGPELDVTFQTWSRRGRMTSTLLALTDADQRAEDPAVRQRVDCALTRLQDPFFVSMSSPTTVEPSRPVLRRRVEPLDAAERLEVWQAHVHASRTRLQSRRTRGLTAELARLAGDFRLGARTVRRICLEAESVLAGREGPVEPSELAALLREGCARSVRVHLDPLADRVALDSVKELALPPAEARQIAELELTIRLASEVGVGWGLNRGRTTTGTTALFAGPSGTGKTHAAYVLARRLGLDLYRTSLAGVLSKYIGETEKNLERIFEAAAVGGVILLFDEADALFGKRSEVRDSHDRYANLSTAYLLSRIEEAPTPVILTTNLKEAIDPGFLRRLHFVVDFPFPSSDQRAEIWREIYPDQTPVGELAHDRLSQVAATGGTITNIARRGAFLAAAEPNAVEMRHLFDASQRELRKLGREMTPDELDAWR
jgi:hypothetical protein